MVIFSILAFEVGGRSTTYTRLCDAHPASGGRPSRQGRAGGALHFPGRFGSASGRLRLGDRAQAVRFDLEREVDEVVVVLHRVQPCDLDDLPVTEVLA